MNKQELKQKVDEFSNRFGQAVDQDAKNAAIAELKAAFDIAVDADVDVLSEVMRLIALNGDYSLKQFVASPKPNDPMLVVPVDPTKGSFMPRMPDIGRGFKQPLFWFPLEASDKQINDRMMSRSIDAIGAPIAIDCKMEPNGTLSFGVVPPDADHPALTPVQDGAQWFNEVKKNMTSEDKIVTLDSIPTFGELDSFSEFDDSKMTARIHRAFKERLDGTYFSTDGWTIVKEGEADIDTESWVLRDPDGKVISEKNWLHQYADDFPYELFSYDDRYGRHGKTDMDIKFGPHHFPEGTIVEVNPEHKDHLGGNRFTVDHITVTGARNWVLTMKEVRPGVPGSAIFAGEAREYNLHHVWKIISRGTGKVRIEDDCPEYPRVSLEVFLRDNQSLIGEITTDMGLQKPKLAKGEMLFASYARLISVLLNYVGIEPDHKGKYIDESKIFRNMKSRNFGRLVTLRGDNGDNWESFYVFHVERLARWIKNHQHQLFMRLSQVQKLEEEEDRRQSDALCRDMADMD